MLFDEYHSEAWSILPEVARQMPPEATFDPSYYSGRAGAGPARLRDSPLVAELLHSVEAQLIGERRCRPARCDLLSRRDTAHLLTSPPRTVNRLRSSETVNKRAINVRGPDDVGTFC